MKKIPGGYYIKARQIKYSDIAHAPPHIREIWDYLLREANHSGKKKYGEILERGQILTTYDEIREALHWMIGWRKQMYSKSQCEIAMKFLRKQRRNGSMIATRKTTRGLVITILNYGYYQDPKNYERHSECRKEHHDESCDSPQTPDTIDKNGKNGKNDNNTPPTPPKGNGSILKNYPYPEWLNRELWADFYRMRSRIKKPITTKRTITGLINALEKLTSEGYEQDEIIQTAIDQCWRSFYPPKKQKPDEEWVV